MVFFMKINFYMRAEEERKLWTVLLLTRVPALPLLLVLGQGIRELTGVLPALCPSFPTCKEEKTGHSSHRAGTDPTSSDSSAVSLHWHQWRNILTKKRGVLRTMPGGKMFPFTFALAMPEDREFHWEGTKVSPSF